MLHDMGAAGHGSGGGRGEWARQAAAHLQRERRATAGAAAADGEAVSVCGGRGDGAEALLGPGPGPGFDVSGDNKQQVANIWTAHSRLESLNATLRFSNMRRHKVEVSSAAAAASPFTPTLPAD
jgi:hypothetical protein